jgi:hypothetical protein
MRHFASSECFRTHERLPSSARVLVDKAYNLLRQDPNHPALRFKQMGRYWSMPIGPDHRALGVAVEDDGVLWFWMGSHADYDRLIGR